MIQKPVRKVSNGIFHNNTIDNYLLRHVLNVVHFFVLRGIASNLSKDVRWAWCNSKERMC